MTKKDYELIAACLGAAYAKFNNSKMLALDDLASRLELEFELDNPKFNTEKFQGRINYWIDKHSND